MEAIVEILLEWGLTGLLIAAFTESFISPVLPDLLLIPLALANPQNAIYYGLATTVVSVLGGVIGYMLGLKIGLPAARKFIPDRYIDKIYGTVKENALWAVFLASLSPIPYKFVSITAGALKINMPLFFAISFLGRGKRFLLEGVLIYYFGPQAVAMFNQHKDDLMIISLIVIAGIGLIAYVMKKSKKAKPMVNEL
ncbi:YqaA family protein [Sporomusa malonica]|uniref:Membrane protein YqaA, SNARE-associated domain n=1 Tax=Sporomusa malonica TaxID=112901 RepID=A0A1W2CCM9_9FIRM|nr:VTT domain-containing protein [Sporomusa malonica]SMC82632.1 membrane protein YqaA, SNARE-associated domain [Sporomusa malonica]